MGLLKKIKKGIKGVTQIASGDYLGGALSIAGGFLGSKGAKDAGKASAAGMRQGADFLTNQLGQTSATFQPYMDAGTAALTRLNDPNAYEASPGYAWARDQGLDAIKTQQNSLGRLASGNTLAALTDYGTGLAQQDYNNWWNQQHGLAGMGLNATGNRASTVTGLSNSIAQLLAGAGNAKAQGIQGATDAWGNTIDGLQGYVGRATASQTPGMVPGRTPPYAPEDDELDMGLRTVKMATPRNFLAQSSTLGNYTG